MNPSDEPWLAWCDGTASPNPGRIGLGVVLVSPDGERQEMSLPSGHSGCNNEAELRAIGAALELARKHGARTLNLCSDSRFAIDCLTGIDSTEVARLADLLATIREALTGFDCVVLRWLPRHRNGEADRLARTALGLAPKPATGKSKQPKKRRR